MGTAQKDHVSDFYIKYGNMLLLRLVVYFAVNDAVFDFINSLRKHERQFALFNNNHNESIQSFLMLLYKTNTHKYVEHNKYL